MNYKTKNAIISICLGNFISFPANDPLASIIHTFTTTLLDITDITWKQGG